MVPTSWMIIFFTRRASFIWAVWTMVNLALPLLCQKGHGEMLAHYMQAPTVSVDFNALSGALKQPLQTRVPWNSLYKQGFGWRGTPVTSKGCCATHLSLAPFHNPWRHSVHAAPGTSIFAAFYRRAHKSLWHACFTAVHRRVAVEHLCFHWGRLWNFADSFSNFEVLWKYSKLPNNSSPVQSGSRIWHH